jgi:hypothetical protein
MALRLRILPAACALLLALGCGGNDGALDLVPTGVRPLPENPSGGLTGFVRHDSTAFPGLLGAPFPPTTITLLRAGIEVAEDTLGGLDRGFAFRGVAPGAYTLLARSHAFRPSVLGPVTVRDAVRDAGDIYMEASPDSIELLTFLIGTMPGYGADQLATFLTLLEQAPLGVWTYPSTFFEPVAVPAGTYRFKFVTDLLSTDGALTGWGGDSTEVLVAPVTQQPLRFGSGPATDLRMTFPTTGVYQFVLDERRLTFSVSLLPPSATRQTRAAR